MHIPYKKQIFPIHIFQSHIKENELLKEELLLKIKEICKEEDLPIPEGWQTSKMVTTFENNVINDKLFGPESIVHKIYPLYVNKFFDKPSEFMVKEMWFNYYDNGEYQEKHAHVGPNKSPFNLPQSQFSIIHYLRFDPKVHQSTTFIDPLETLRCSSLEMVSNDYGIGTYTPGIREGSILMFPSYLQHCVEKSKPTPNNPRITIAFNLIVKKYGNGEE